MNNGDLSVLIIDGESEFSLHVLRCLAQVPRLKVHVLSNAPWAKTRFSRHRASFHLHDHAGNDDGYLETIGRVAKRVNADVILPVDQPGIRFAADHRLLLEKFAAITSVPQLDVFDIAVDKWLLTDFMQKQRIPTPQTILYTAATELGQQLDALTFPVLIKPTHGGSGRGIQQFNDRTSLGRFLEKEREDTCSYIIQDQVQGYDIDCSVLCQDGEILAYTIQKGIIMNPDRFLPPLAIKFLWHEEVLRVMSKLLAALKWNGVAHVDLVMDEKDHHAKVIDFNARYWGSLLGSLAAGVNFPHIACLAAINKPLPSAEYRHIRYISPSAVRQVRAQKSLANGVPEFRFSETGWRYMLADPMPATIEKLSSSWRKLWKIEGQR